MILDIKLDFQEYLKDKLSNISKAIGILRELHKILTRPPLLTIYKSFIRPHPDYSRIFPTGGMGGVPPPTKNLLNHPPPGNPLPHHHQIFITPTITI